MDQFYFMLVNNCRNITVLVFTLDSIAKLSAF